MGGAINLMCLSCGTNVTEGINSRVKPSMLLQKCLYLGKLPNPLKL